MSEPGSTLRSVEAEAVTAVEALRMSFRPDQITTLFVGESSPVNGTFFYDGDNSMVRYMQRAVEAVLPDEGNFLDRFRGYGWYLDDLVLTPINHLQPSARRAAWLRASNSLAGRIDEYRPLAIVSLLSGIKRIVEGRRKDCGQHCNFIQRPIPRHGQSEEVSLGDAGHCTKVATSLSNRLAIGRTSNRGRKVAKAKTQQGSFGWERGFDPKLLLELVSEHRTVESGRVAFKGTSRIYWQPVLNSAVRTNINIGSLKNRCISASINDGSISLQDPDEFLEACAHALDRLRRLPKSPFVVYSSLTYEGPKPLSVIQDDQVKVVWYSPDAKSSFLRKANNAREPLSNLLTGRKVQKEVSRFTTLLSYVSARDFTEAHERATRSVDRIRGLLNLLVNSSRGVNPFGGLTAPHAINKFRNGPYQTVHRLDGSLAAEMFWYEPRWHHDAESVRFSDPSDYGRAIRKWWMRYRSNPLKEHISDGLLRYCKALDIHDFEPSLIGMWSTLEALTGSHRGDTVVTRIKALFKDHREAEMVANHIRMRRNSHVHAATTPDSKEHDPILVQLNILVSQILFFCLSEGKNFKNVEELFTFLDFSLDQPWLHRQQSLARFFLRYQGR